MARARPTAQELLSRLVYAEGRSTGYPADRRVYEAIAWGVMNRVRLGEASEQMGKRYGESVFGVIFRKGQFNPAVSSRSPFSRDFLCPKDAALWKLAVQGARRALEGRENPFVQTAWERAHGLSLVVNFYYPHSVQARGPLPPWEGDPGLELVKELDLRGPPLPLERIRFYRLTRPPPDIEEASRED